MQCAGKTLDSGWHAPGAVPASVAHGACGLPGRPGGAREIHDLDLHIVFVSRYIRFHRDLRLSPPSGGYAFDVGRDCEAESGLSGQRRLRDRNELFIVAAFRDLESTVAIAGNEDLAREDGLLGGQLAKDKGIGPDGDFTLYHAADPYGDFGLVGKIRLERDRSPVIALFRTVGNPEPVMFSFFQGLEAAHRFFLQVVFHFLYVESPQIAEKIDALFGEPVGHSLKCNGFFGPHFDQGLNFSLHRNDNAGSGGVIAQDRGCLLDKTLKTSEIEL